MTFVLNKSYTDMRVLELFDLFMKGDINMNDINQENFKVYDRFFYYARQRILEKNKENTLPGTINKNQRSIFKFLKIKICCNKHCSSWNEILPIGVSSCASCKIRKAKNKLNCRLNKKIKQKVFEKSESEKESNDCLCSICFDNMDVASVLPCGHCFHQNCINHWLVENRENCPNCRLDLNLNLNIKYNKKKTFKQRLENMRHISIQNEKKRRSYIRRQNIRARAQMNINQNGVSYSNERGFSYERFGAVFPYYTVVRIVKRRIYDLRGSKRSYIREINYDWVTTFTGRINRYLQENSFEEPSVLIIDETHIVSDIETPTGANH
jgi:hypothetical protein